MTKQELINLASKEKLTGQDMCIVVCGTYKLSTGEELDPEKFWNSDPTGHLFHVYEEFRAAQLLLGFKITLNKKTFTWESVPPKTDHEEGSFNVI